jgi:hypothetical protein
MYKLLLCHRRRRDISNEALAAHFRGPRAALVRSQRAALGYTTYAQLHQSSRGNPLYQGIRLTRVPQVTALVSGKLDRACPIGEREAFGLSEESWDVVEELEYPAREAISKALASAASKRAASQLAADHAKVSRHSAVVVAEYFVSVPRPAAPPGATTLFFLRTVPGMTRDQMLDYWGNSHKQLFVSLQPTLGYVAYAQLHVRSGPDVTSVAQTLGDAGGVEFDGVAEVGYADQARIARSFVSPKALWANVGLVRDEVGFIDSRKSSLVYGTQNDGIPV